MSFLDNKFRVPSHELDPFPYFSIIIECIPESSKSSYSLFLIDEVKGEGERQSLLVIFPSSNLGQLDPRPPSTSGRAAALPAPKSVLLARIST